MVRFFYFIFCLFLLLPRHPELKLDKALCAVVSREVTIGKYTANSSMDMRDRVASSFSLFLHLVSTRSPIVAGLRLSIWLEPWTFHQLDVCSSRYVSLL